VLEHPLSPATHTVELAQLTELNEALARPGASKVTAGDLGVAASLPTLPPDAVLTELDFDGPPDYPYIHGQFAVGSSGPRAVELHTPALRQLSHRLHLHHTWGV
jgi:hypothetical protein